MCYDRISRWRILLFSLRVFLAYRQEAVMGIQNKITSLIFMAVSLIYLLPSPALAQNLDSNAVVAADAYTFAKDIANVSQNDPVFKALENARNEQLGEGNKADGEIKAGNYIQCGNQICNLDTQYCYQVTYQGKYKHFECFNEPQFDHSEGFLGYYKYKYEPCFSSCVKGNKPNVIDVSKPDMISMTGSDGKKYQVHIGDTISVQYANESNKATRGCEVLPVKLYNYRKCFFCPLVGVIYDGSAKITDVAFTKMAGAFSTLLVIGFAIWIALQVLTQVSSLTKQDAPKFLGSLIKQSYKVVIAFILLQNSQQIFTYVVRPILEAGLVFGQNMLTTNKIFSGLDYDDNGNYVRQAKAVTGGQHYKLGTYDRLEKFVVAVQREIAFMQAVGTSLVCTGSNLMLLKEGISGFGDGFQMFIQGAVLAIFGFLLSLAFVFYLIDAIVQFGVVGALLPFLIASWPFKVTSKYTSTGTQMLLNSAFLFLFVGLVISANIFLINEALNQTVDEQESELLSLCQQEDYFSKNKETCSSVLEKTPRMGALFEIAQTLNSLDSTKLRSLTDISSMGFLILLFCCIFGFKFTGQAIPLADKFASGSISKPIAPGIATMGASFAKSTALRATKNIREAAGDRVERVAKGFVGLVPRGINAAWRKMRGKDKKPAGTGGNPNPQTTGSSDQNTANGGGNNTRSAATLNENTQRTQRPTLNEQNSQAAASPTLSEGQASGQPDKMSTSPKAPVLSEGQNDQDAADDNSAMPTSEEPSGDAQEKNSSPEEQTQESSTKPHLTGQTAEPQNNRQSGQMRRPTVNTAHNTRQTYHQKSKGGSKHNRNKHWKRRK